jgi:hypothetical protein
MQMLTADVYEAIGRLTVAFNDVDYMMTSCITDLTGDGEVGEAQAITEENDPGFGRKRDTLKGLLKVVGREFPELGARIKALVALLGEAKQLSNRRNEHIHSLVFRDIGSKTIRFRYRGVPKPVDADAISSAAKESAALFHKLIDAYSYLAEDLRQARGTKKLRETGVE